MKNSTIVKKELSDVFTFMSDNHKDTFECYTGEYGVNMIFWDKDDNILGHWENGLFIEGDNLIPSEHRQTV